MKHLLPALCALAAALTLATPALRAQQDDATLLLDGAQKGLEKLKKEVKAQSDARKQTQELLRQIKALAEKQTELGKSIEMLQQARRDGEAFNARQTDKVQHLSRQVDHLETQAQEFKKTLETLSKAATTAAPTPPPVPPVPAPVAPPVQATPGPTPAAAPSPAPTPAS